MNRIVIIVALYAGALSGLPVGAQTRPDLAPPVFIVAIDTFGVSGSDAAIIRTADPDSGDIIAIRSTAVNAAGINAALDELLLLRRIQGDLAAQPGLYKVTLRESAESDSARKTAPAGRERDREARVRVILFMLRDQHGKRKVVPGAGEGVVMEYRYRLKPDSSGGTSN